MTVFDTGGPQGPPPTASDPAGGVSPLNLDRLAGEAKELGDPAAALWSMRHCSSFSREALALVDRVRALEAVVDIVRVRRARFADSNGWPAMHPKSPEEEALDAALAVVDGGGRDGQ